MSIVLDNRFLEGLAAGDCFVVDAEPDAVLLVFGAAVDGLDVVPTVLVGGCGESPCAERILASSAADGELGDGVCCAGGAELRVAIRSFAISAADATNGPCFDAAILFNGGGGGG